MGWPHELEDRPRSQTWRPQYGLPPGERLTMLETAIEAEFRHQATINGSTNSRLDKLEQAHRRAEQMSRLKLARKAARRDVVKTVQWVVTILASTAYVVHLVATGQWLALLHFALGSGP
jgi:hypothetical protein